jgi:hypothetical protein
MDLHKAAPGRPIPDLLAAAFQLLAEGIDSGFGPVNQKGHP